jgi:hypothetical protein
LVRLTNEAFNWRRKPEARDWVCVALLAVVTPTLVDVCPTAFFEKQTSEITTAVARIQLHMTGVRFWFLPLI